MDGQVSVRGQFMDDTMHGEDPLGMPIHHPHSLTMALPVPPFDVWVAPRQKKQAAVKVSADDHPPSDASPSASPVHLRYEAKMDSPAEIYSKMKAFLDD